MLLRQEPGAAFGSVMNEPHCLVLRTFPRSTHRIGQHRHCGTDSGIIIAAAVPVNSWPWLVPSTPPGHRPRAGKTRCAASGLDDALAAELAERLHYLALRGADLRQDGGITQPLDHRVQDLRYQGRGSSPQLARIHRDPDHVLE